MSRLRKSGEVEPGIQIGQLRPRLCSEAEKWVNSMTKTRENESTRVVLEPRPARLGIGAAVPRVSKVVYSNDPVERKLRAKLNAGKRRVANIEKESADNERRDDSSSDEESESRTKTFVKKRPPTSNSFYNQRRNRNNSNICKSKVLLGWMFIFCIYFVFLAL